MYIYIYTHINYICDLVFGQLAIYRELKYYIDSPEKRSQLI